MSNENVPNDDGLVDRTKLHLTIMKHNGMPDLAVKNWAAIAADMGLSVATVKQQFGKDKKAFHIANQAGPPPAPVIKRRNRNKQNVAAANDDNEEVEDEGNMIDVPAAPAAPAAAASSTRTRKARGSNRNVAAASAHSDNDSVDEVNDHSVNNPAPWQPRLALLVLLPPPPSLSPTSPREEPSALQLKSIIKRAKKLTDLSPGTGNAGLLLVARRRVWPSPADQGVPNSRKTKTPSLVGTHTPKEARAI
ncbi:hypothetical protein PG995_003175 [Apiospora arundinis]